MSSTTTTTTTTPTTPITTPTTQHQHEHATATPAATPAATTTATTTEPQHHHDADADAASATPIDECVICCQSMGFDERLSKPYTCSHMFHTDCLAPWDQHSFLCPCCRARKTRVPHIADNEDQRLEAMRREWRLAVAYQDGRNDQEAFVHRLVGATRDRSGR